MSGVNLYFIIKLGTDTYKIGVTNNLSRRLRELQTSNDCPLVVHYTIEYKTRNEALANERIIHKSLVSKKIFNEWYELSSRDVGSIESVYDLVLIRE